MTALIDSAAAYADCGPGHTATYSDVESIYVEREGVAEPHFTMMVTRRGEIYFTGRWKAPILGEYDGFDGSALFDDLLQILRKHDFYSMQLKPMPESTPGPDGIIGRVTLDGPDDRVALQRCGVVTKIETIGANDGVFQAYFDDPQTRVFVEFVNELQDPVFAWHWQKERAEARPTPTVSTKP
jgi:hypothetical protein